jgi:hypothetical protein
MARNLCFEARLLPLQLLQAPVRLVCLPQHRLQRDHLVCAVHSRVDGPAAVGTNTGVALLASVPAAAGGGSAADVFIGAVAIDRHTARSAAAAAAGTGTSASSSGRERPSACSCCKGCGATARSKGPGAPAAAASAPAAAPAHRPHLIVVVAAGVAAAGVALAVAVVSACASSAASRAATARGASREAGAGSAPSGRARAACPTAGTTTAGSRRSCGEGEAVAALLLLCSQLRLQRQLVLQGDALVLLLLLLRVVSSVNLLSLASPHDTPASLPRLSSGTADARKRTAAKTAAKAAAEAAAVAAQLAAERTEAAAARKSKPQRGSGGGS